MAADYRTSRLSLRAHPVSFLHDRPGVMGMVRFVPILHRSAGGTPPETFCPSGATTFVDSLFSSRRFLKIMTPYWQWREPVGMFPPGIPGSRGREDKARQGEPDEIQCESA